MIDDFINNKISEFLMTSHFNFEDVKNMYLVHKNNQLGIILLNNYINKQKMKYDMNDFMYNLLLSKKNIKLTFLNNEFLDKLFKRVSITTYTVHKIIMFDRLIGKFFANYFIKYLQNKYNINNYLDLIAKIVNKKSILNYPFLKLFNSKSNKFMIENMNKGNARHIIYLLCIYHGYIWFNKPINYYNKYGGNYELDDYINKYGKDYEYDYITLKFKKIYSPEYFTKIGDKCYLRNDCSTYKRGVACRTDNITIIKI